jgi:hypothetical protein
MNVIAPKHLGVIRDRFGVIRDRFGVIRDRFGVIRDRLKFETLILSAFQTLKIP